MKPAARTEPVVFRLFVNWLPLGVAFWLLGPGKWHEHLLWSERFVPKSPLVKLVGVAVLVAGLAIACWARALLGRNWSGEVVVKEGHELVERGPYRVVRHPIYTGLLVAMLGTAIKVGDWRGLLAVAIAFVSFWAKLRREERWLGEHFGAPYRDYVGRTRALVPGLL